MSDYHNAVHRAVGYDLECRVCRLLDMIGALPHGEHELVVDRLIDAFQNQRIVVRGTTGIRVEGCQRPCCRRSP